MATKKPTVKKVAKLYKVVISWIFGEGVLLSQRLSGSGNQVSECLFDDGNCYRVLLTDSHNLMICLNIDRKLTRAEAKSLRRRALNLSLKADTIAAEVPESVHIPDTHIQLDAIEGVDLEADVEVQEAV